MQNSANLERAATALLQQAPLFQNLRATQGLPLARMARNELASLLQIITQQLISVKAARTIWQHILATIDPLTAENLLNFSPTDLQKMGLTRQKAHSFHLLAMAEHKGFLNFEYLARLEDDAAKNYLCQHKGIGPWTADIYLLTVLGRPDIWPIHDLALQLALENLLNLTLRPNPAAMQELAKDWQPHRSCAALFLWQHYHHMRKLIA